MSILIAEDDAAARTISLGVADTLCGKTSNEIIAAADSALYRAKDRGRNRVEHASS